MIYVNCIKDTTGYIKYEKQDQEGRAAFNERNPTRPSTT
jgi:hypothetical protein